MGSRLTVSRISRPPHLGFVPPLCPPPIPRVERLHEAQIGAAEVVVSERERADGNRGLRVDREPHVGRRRVEERVCKRPAYGRGLRDREAVKRPARNFAAEEDGGRGVHVVSIVGVNVEGVFSFVAGEEGSPQSLEWHLICTSHPIPLNLKGQCKPHGLGIIMREFMFKTSTTLHQMGFFRIPNRAP